MWARTVNRLLWRVLAAACLLLGLVGVFVPVLPTVPFLLLAAWAGGLGWPALEQWLLNHPRYGAHIRHWRASGAVPRRAKWAASTTMLLSAAIIVATPLPLWLKVAVPVAMVVVAAWLWCRPEP